MKITDKQVDRMCEVLAENDWLPYLWDATGDAKCTECGHPHHYGQGDGGEGIRLEVRGFLERTFNESN